tara:strand:- start:6342 stop:7091 length:750 start_codon:yes stop_codon:yes gene_type:complete
MKYRPRLTKNEFDLIQEFRNRPNILVIGDTHIPFNHPGYLDFCRSVQEKYRCNTVVHIGDECDNAALSYHEKTPEGHSAESEAELALNELQKWYKAFPEVKVCVGNHSALPYRQATTAGIPKRFLKTYEEVWQAPKGWKWELEWVINDCIFTHGTGTNGQQAAIKRAILNQQSTIIGHTHSFGGVNYIASKNNLIFGLNVGCGIDIDAYAFAYGRNYPRRPTLGCGVVLDKGRCGLFIPMDLGIKYVYK